MECVAENEVNCALKLKCQKLQSYKILEIRSTSDKIFLSLKFVFIQNFASYAIVLTFAAVKR